MSMIDDFEAGLRRSRLRRFEDLLMRDISRMTPTQRRKFLRELGPYVVMGVAPKFVKRMARKHVIPRLKQKLASKALGMGIQLDTLLALEDAAK